MSVMALGHDRNRCQCTLPQPAAKVLQIACDIRRDDGCVRPLLAGAGWLLAPYLAWV